MQDPASLAGNGALYLFLGTVVAQIGGLLLYWLRDRSAARKEQKRREYEVEDRNRLVKQVEKNHEEAIQPIKDELDGSAKDRQRLLSMLEQHQKDIQETKSLVQKQNGPRDKNARERRSDKLAPVVEGDKRQRIRRASDSQTVATSRLAQATDQAAAATTNLADTVQAAADEQKATAHDLALATAKVAVHAVEQTEIIADSAKRAAGTLDDIATIVKRIEDKDSNAD